MSREKISVIALSIILILTMIMPVYAVDLDSIPDNTLKIGDDLYSMTSDSMLDPDGTNALNSLLKEGPNKNMVYYKYGGEWYEPYALTGEQFLDPAYAMTDAEAYAEITGFYKWYQEGDTVVWLTDDPILSDIAEQMQEIYQYLGELVIDEAAGTVSIGDADKQKIRDARAAIGTLTEGEWDTVLGTGADTLLTPEVAAKFGTEDAAKQAIIDFVTGFSEIYYSTDTDELIDIMRSFRDTYTPTFKTLFGDDVTMSDLYDLIYQAKLELPVVASANKTELKGLLQAPDADLIDAMYEYGKEAMTAALAGHSLSGKLSAIGWSMDTVLDRQQILSQIIDPSRDIELALGKAYIRSQTDLITEIYDLSTGQGQAYAISVFGIGEEEGLASLVDWYSTDDAIVEAAPAYLTAVSSGTATIIVYRAGDLLVPDDTNPEDDWILRFDITVTE